MKIDSHHHFWNYDPVEYAWMNEDMGLLKRDFGPPDLKKEIDEAGIDGWFPCRQAKPLVKRMPCLNMQPPRNSYAE
ncbi:MAG: hypothetical protein VCA36_06700 [Opitutales bacterium]